MSDREDLTQAALEIFPQGVALVNREDKVVFWNHAAENCTGFPAIEIISRRIPTMLEPLLFLANAHEGSELAGCARGRVVHAQHRTGHEVHLFARMYVLRSELGMRTGTAIVFHPSDVRDSLPHAEVLEDSDAAEMQADFEERLEELFDELMERAAPFGLIWMMVDQAHDLRRTHGLRACEAMLDRLEQTVSNGLHPAEEIGRWSDNEFIVLSNESSPERIAAHAHVLAGMARTTDFRWWGDRLSITMSVGAAFALPGETMIQLLERAHTAMLISSREGGNHTSLAPGRLACSPS